MLSIVNGNQTRIGCAICGDPMWADAEDYAACPEGCLCSECVDMNLGNDGKDRRSAEDFGIKLPKFGMDLTTRP